MFLAGGERQAQLEMTAIPAKKQVVGLLIIVATLLLGIGLDIWRIHQRPVSVDSSSVRPDADAKTRQPGPEPRTQQNRVKAQEASRLKETFENKTSQDPAVVGRKNNDLHGSTEFRKSKTQAAERLSRSPSKSAQAKAARPEPQKSPVVSARRVFADGPVRNQSQEVLALPVIHDHFLGNCRGTLTVSRQSVTFEPFSSSGHGFKAKPSEVSLTNLEDRLEIRFNNKSYRFKVDPKIDKAENRSRLEAISQHLNKINAGNGPN